VHHLRRKLGILATTIDDRRVRLALRMSQIFRANRDPFLRPQDRIAIQADGVVAYAPLVRQLNLQGADNIHH